MYTHVTVCILPLVCRYTGQGHGGVNSWSSQVRASPANRHGSHPSHRTTPLPYVKRGTLTQMVLHAVGSPLGQLPLQLAVRLQAQPAHRPEGVDDAAEPCGGDVR